jgi:hypothetical protein
MGLDLAIASGGVKERIIANALTEPSLVLGG